MNASLVQVACKGYDPVGLKAGEASGKGYLQDADFLIHQLTQVPVIADNQHRLAVLGTCVK